jgi:hypothetical protein
MEMKFDPKAKVKQGQLSDAPDYDPTVPTKSGSEHVEDSLFKMADEKDY